jgi:hypothetical protein
MNQSSMVILGLCVAAFAPACGSDDSKCDPGQVEQNSVCVAAQGGAVSTGGSAGVATGGAADPGQGGSGSAIGGESSIVGAGGSLSTGGAANTAATADLFGVTCTSDTDCTAPVGYCAIQPGTTSGYCTQTGCKTDATICPSTWSCFDLSALGVPNGPNFCMKPS